MTESTIRWRSGEELRSIHESVFVGISLEEPPLRIGGLSVRLEFLFAQTTVFVAVESFKLNGSLFLCFRGGRIGRLLARAAGGGEWFGKWQVVKVEYHFFDEGCTQAVFDIG